jgi:hypothetical protein
MCCSTSSFHWQPPKITDSLRRSWQPPKVTDNPHMSLTPPHVTDNPKGHWQPPTCHWQSPKVTDSPQMSLTASTCHWQLPHIICLECEWIYKSSPMDQSFPHVNSVSFISFPYVPIVNFYSTSKFCFTENSIVSPPEASIWGCEIHYCKYCTVCVCVLRKHFLCNFHWLYICVCIYWNPSCC